MLPGKWELKESDVWWLEISCSYLLKRVLSDEGVSCGVLDIQARLGCSQSRLHVDCWWLFGLEFGMSSVVCFG